MATASKKRKLADEAAPVKYYAVLAGHKPGVYTEWAECQKNTTGFKGAQFKSFLSEQDAKDFIAGRVVKGIPSGRTGKPEEAKFYGVAVGIKPGVYEEWVDAQKQITGVKGPKYKKFTGRTEAEEFVKSGGKVSKAAEKSEKVGDISAEVERAVKKARTTTASSSKGTIRVWTDGSSLGNGKKGALAGVGVFFGVDDERNLSESLEGEVQTNQRAELTAVQRALEIVPKDRNILIITDSNYSINCSTVWYKSWMKNQWKTSQGGPVINKDLVVAIRALIDQRDAQGSNTSFEWIKGHSNDPSNEAADRLAVAGARAHRT